MSQVCEQYKKIYLQQKCRSHTSHMCEHKLTPEWHLAEKQAKYRCFRHYKCIMQSVELPNKFCPKNAVLAHEQKLWYYFVKLLIKLQAAKLTFRLSQTFRPWFLRSSWPIIDFQSPSSNKQFPLFYFLIYQLPCTFYKQWPYKMLYFLIVSFFFNHIYEKNDCVLNHTFVSRLN